MNVTKQRKQVMLSAVVLVVILFFNSVCGAFPFPGILEAHAETNVVEDYYKSLNTELVGNEFRAELATLITNTHTHKTTYDDLKEVYKKSDADPNNPGNILWFYTGESVSYDGTMGSSIGTTNREHVWPKNAGNAFPEKSNAGSDAHHLRPVEFQLNSTRNNNSFGEVEKTAANIVKQNNSTSYSNLCYQGKDASGDTLFYPGEGYRGATARILMYLQVRWGDTYNLEFVDAAGNNKTIGKISDLMKWHLEEPPTAAEILRNEEVYKIQGNRNPFIDHPEYAEKIFCYDGKSYNDTLKNVVAQYGSSEVVDIESITLSPATLSVGVGQTVTLEATVSPANATKALVWTTSDAEVLTVAGGKVTALKAGKATVTVSSAKDSAITASVEVTVNAVKSINVVGTLENDNYEAGNKFDPTGLTVIATYEDGSVAVIPNDLCTWVDGESKDAVLANGSSSVLCQVFGLEDCVKGITVKGATTAKVSLTVGSFPNPTAAYAWQTWTAGDISGEAFIYGANNNFMQMNKTKTSQYIFNTVAVPGDIVSISIKLHSSTNAKAVNWEVLTQSTAYSEVAGIPTTGTSHGVKVVDKKSDTATVWELNTSDRFFTINYAAGSSGAAYISEIVIEYSTGAAGGDAGEHVFGDWIAEVPASCKAEGTLGHYHCTHCDGDFDTNKKVLADLTIEKLEHTPGEWVVTKEPTATVDGSRHKLCTICGDELEVEKLPAREKPVLPETGDNTAMMIVLLAVSVIACAALTFIPKKKRGI